MKRGLVRFWTCLNGSKSRPTLSGKLASADLSEDEILGHIFELRDRLAAKPHKKAHETILYNLGGSIAVELIRSVHGPVGTLSLTQQSSAESGIDFLVDVLANASARDINWSILLDGVPVDGSDGFSLAGRTWVIGSHRRLASAAASAV
jgi:hypothetical protein